jgi:hypothetical protein
VCQILEVEDEWNILKSTLHERGVQKISITLAILVGFLVNSLFHETKIPTVDMKVQVNSKFRNFLLALRSVGAELQKMGVLYTHSPKSPGPFSKLPKIHFF